MITLDERIQIGMKVFERILPALHTRRPSPTPAPPPETDVEEANLPNEDIEWDQQSVFDPLPTSLEALLENSQPLPTDTILFGMCEDGLPFLLDLSNPAPGSILIAGDAGSGKTRLLNAILDSAIRLNPEGQVSFSLIARDPEEYQRFSETDHCQHVLLAGERSAEELIEELTTLAEERRRNKPEGPTLILAIDDLSSCLEFLDTPTFTRLYWLIKHGPRSRVWTIATLPASKAGQIDPRFLSSFRTRLLGSILDAKLAESLSGDGELRPRELESGSQFYVPYGEGWLRFWISDSEGGKAQ